MIIDTSGLISWKSNVSFHEGRPWGVEADCAVPSATQNEVNAEEAAVMIKNGVKAVAEAANMPCEQGAVDAFMEAHVLFGPAKAVNAGGVGVSGLEMSQNSARISWDEEELRRLCQVVRKVLGIIYQRLRVKGVPQVASLVVSSRCL